MTKLFSQFKIKNITIPNRVVLPPMCQYTAKEDGKVTDWHIVHYGARAIGKVGLIIVEATGVEPRGRITDNDLGIWSNEHVEGLKRLVDFGHEQGSIMAIQLAHAGRKATITKQDTVIAPSAIPFDEESVTPREMTEADIIEVINAFAMGARRANVAGFDLIEIHGAHGYLINQFLSPVTNKRTDSYGVTREGRTRFLKEIILAIKQEWPEEKPILLRVSATEYIENGINVNEMIEILKQAKEWGVDIIDVSSGGLLPININLGVGYQIKLSEKIREEVGLPTITVGLITEPELAEEIIFNERADFVALGRELLRNPHWPLQAATKLNHDIEWSKPYQRSKR